MLKLPSGISNFEILVNRGLYYVDRTSYIELLENLSASYLFFLRPRRFGKSLWISILQYYYGLEHKDKFTHLFGQYYIGQNPTTLANSYMVLVFDFSGIVTHHADGIWQSFFHNVKRGIQNFLDVYQNHFSDSARQDILSQAAPERMLGTLLTYILALKDQKVYILIDEYDHFTNELISFQLHEFKDIVSEDGYVRKFYELMKTGTREGVVDRMFVTGVSPVTLDSLTSGFNISKNISLSPAFNEMMGFTEREVIDILKGLYLDHVQINDLLQELKQWYNGYLFQENGKYRIYNPDMILYFASEYQTNGAYPSNLLDTNISSDYSKIRQLFRIGGKEQDRFKKFEEILMEGTIGVEITQSYSFHRPFTDDDFLSLLFYMGLLTIKDLHRGGLRLEIPNEVIRQLYFKYFAQVIEERSDLNVEAVNIRASVEALAWENNPSPLIELIEQTLSQLSNRDWRGFDEKHVKTILVAFLYSVKIFHIKSEPEYSQQYPDLLLRKRRPFNPPYQFMIELKFLHKKDAQKLETVTKQAQKQLIGYFQDEELQQLAGLRAWIFVFVGTEAKIIKEIHA